MNTLYVFLFLLILLGGSVFDPTFEKKPDPSKIIWIWIPATVCFLLFLYYCLVYNNLLNLRMD